MKTKHARVKAPLCEDCARAFQELIRYHVNPEQAETVANGIRMAMRGNQQAFQELAFHLAHMTALSRRAFHVLTGCGLDDTLIGHMKNMDVGSGRTQRVVPPDNCSGTQIHVYCNAWLRLNELVRLNPPEESMEELELRLLQQLMSFYQRGAFPQLQDARGLDGNNNAVVRSRP